MFITDSIEIKIAIVIIIFIYYRMSGKSKKPSTVNVDKITKLFDTYIQDPDDPDVLDMAGIGAFSEALGMDPSSDIRLLVLLWKLGSKYKPGCITRTEFCNGMKSLCIDSIPKLKTFLPSLDHGFLERSEFRGKINDIMTLSFIHTYIHIFICIIRHVFIPSHAYTYSSLSYASLHMSIRLF